MNSWKRKLRMGMVGGGQGAFIGAVHRMAAALDGQIGAVRKVIKEISEMDHAATAWELTILDAAPDAEELGSLTVGDLDGDGHPEIVTGGRGGLFWYRPATRERHKIADGHFHVGIALEDVDGDGRMEIAAGDGSSQKVLWWFRSGADMTEPWQRHVLDAETAGGAHDLLFADLDGDGENELIAEAVYTGSPGLYVYKRGADLTQPWKKHCIQSGTVEEGLNAADLNGDGKLEIVNGPDCYYRPPDGPCAGPWKRQIYAPNFREMCRTTLVDITGNGRPDILIVESEYMEGRLSWFENRTVEDPENPWIEHCMDRDLYYAHSLKARREGEAVRLFVGEMTQGGWDAPINRQSRLIEYVSRDKGVSWERTIISQGEGTHEATFADVDGDGEPEIVGKDGYEYVYGEFRNPKIQIWKRKAAPSPLAQLRHRFLDRDKPHTAIDIFAADVKGDGANEVVCGAWWYDLATGKRHAIPGICQALGAYDIDGDGRQELFGLKPKPGQANFYGQLSSQICWLKPLDLERGRWEEHLVGEGHGDWPHGFLIAPLLPGGRLALITGYHDAGEKGTLPELWEIPADPRQTPWPKRILADIRYGEEFVTADIDGDGKPDIVAGAIWLENLGNGQFVPHVMAEGFVAARVGVLDVNGDGRPDVVLGEEVLDFTNRITPKSKLVWLENPPDPRQPWPVHVIDTLRCAHSIGVGDLDGDGQQEIVAGEHDPFWPYRSQCSLYVYKQADPWGLAWTRFRLDDRFEHHDGAKVIDLPNGRKGIVSHGWTDSIYVHLWQTA